MLHSCMINSYTINPQFCLLLKTHGPGHVTWHTRLWCDWSRKYSPFHVIIMINFLTEIHRLIYIYIIAVVAKN